MCVVQEIIMYALLRFLLSNKTVLLFHLPESFTFFFTIFFLNSASVILETEESHRVG